MLAKRQSYLAFSIAVVGLLLWRPMIMGFLTDDLSVIKGPQLWADPFSIDLWNMLEVAQNRPVLHFLLFSLDSIVPRSPVVWHAVGALLNLGATLAVAVFASDMIRLVDPSRKDAANAAGLFAGACWLAFPFSASTQFWATGTTATPAVAAFCISASLLIRNWGEMNGRILLAAFVSLIGYLNYEAFYFHFLLVLAVLAWKRGLPPAARSSIWCFAAAQVAAAVFSRIMRYAGAEGSRGINPNFVDTFFHWFLYVGRSIGIGQVGVYAIVVLVALLLAFFLHYILKRMRPNRRFDAPILAAASLGALAAVITLPLSFIEGLPLIAIGALGILVLQFDAFKSRPFVDVAIVVLVGICFGALPFALGNYVVFSLGMAARATLGLSVWCAFGLGWIAAVALSADRRATLVFSSLIFFGLAISNVARGLEWAAAGRLMVSILENAPSFPNPPPSDGALVVLLGPEGPSRVPVVEVNFHMPKIARLAFNPPNGTIPLPDTAQTYRYRWAVARDLHWQTIWDGTTLSQRACREAAPFAIFEAQEVWIWDPEAARIYQAIAPLAIGCK